VGGGITCGQAPHCRKQHRTETVSDKSERERETKSVSEGGESSFAQSNACHHLNSMLFFPTLLFRVSNALHVPLLAKTITALPLIYAFRELKMCNHAF